MKRIFAVIYAVLGRVGIAVFAIYFLLFAATVISFVPERMYAAFADFILQYYVALRTVSFILNFLVLYITIKVFSKLFQRKTFIIRKRTLGFLVASSVIQLFSFFCYLHVTSNFPANIDTIMQVQQTSHKFIVFEWLALILIGCSIAFYVGSLARAKFATDLIVAPKKQKKKTN